MKQAAEEDFDVKMRDPQMRNLLDRFIRADEAETIIPATADFSFLDLLTADSNTDEAVAEAERQAGSIRAAAEKIAAKDRSVINDWNNRDRALSESFAQRLQEIIDEMKLNTVVTTEIVRRLIELLKSMRQGAKAPEGLESAVASALWNNRKEWTSLTDEAEIIELIKKIDEFFKTKVFAGWKDTSKPAGFKCIKGLEKLIGDAADIEQIFIIHHIAANNINN